MALVAASCAAGRCDAKSRPAFARGGALVMRRSAILKSRPGDGAAGAPLPVAVKRERVEPAESVPANSASDGACEGASAGSGSNSSGATAAGGAQPVRLAQAKPLSFARPLSTATGNAGPAAAAKPFAKPALSAKASASPDMEAAQQTIVKKRKLLNISYKKGATADTKKPPAERASPAPAAAGDASQPERYFLCICVVTPLKCAPPARQYTKRSQKKHKTYEDGVISVKGSIVKLFDMEAKVLGQTNSYSVANLMDLHAGNTLTVGAKELEVGAPIEAARFISGQVFRSQGAASIVVAAPKAPPPAKPFKGHADALSVEKKLVELKPRYDPDAPNALVLSRAPKMGVVPVVVDPHLGRELRPHQRDGVQFMFDCIMGVRGYEGAGCILADEMGLGKTLQAVTLVWTLLKTGPEGAPVLRKVVIVTPSSLVRNWIKEFGRWLGPQRLQPYSVDSAKNKSEVATMLDEFGRLARHQVLIVSYETLRAHRELMAALPVDLLLLDEGHRIKNVAAQISKALAMIPTRRRVLLTGTPLQNDLKEFFAMVDFCNPGILGTPKFFQEFFDRPIMLSRDVSTSDAKRALGEQKFQELSGITSAFMLRRTNRILEDYLPPKCEQVVFCRPSEAQVNLYRFFLGSKQLRHAMQSNAMTSSSLECMSILTKLCNYPELVRHKAIEYLAAEKEEETDARSRRGTGTTLAELFREEADEEEGEGDAGRARPLRVDLSGKLTVLASMLCSIRKTTSDRVVIVSNYTKTLDVMERLFAAHGWKFFRLDGQTDKTKRQSYVDAFNRPTSDAFAFLLSSKAGGTGLNLVGANRLVLFDSDWNPATDRQAMARVWRDGQTKRVYLYRLLLTGTIDEKIWQRQLSKEGLSNSVLDSAFGKVQFSKADLKDIFSLTTQTLCETHDLICDCWRNRGAPGSAAPIVSSANAAFDISRWQHLVDMQALDDQALRLAAAAEPEAISALFRMDTDGKMYVAPEVNAAAAAVPEDMALVLDDDDDDDIVEDNE